MPAFIDVFFSWLQDYASSPWFYLVIFVIAIIDSVFPVVPSETMVIIGGVSAGLHDLSWPLVILAAASGAFMGDNMSYHIGHFFSERLHRRYQRTDKSRARLAWAHGQIHERGGELLITARFIPGGRTIVTLSCGITQQSRKWFAMWAAIAGTIWASYATLLGFIGGRAFQDNHTKAFLVAFSTAIGATVILELIRHFRKKASPTSDHD
jgi:membrane protein DedA with SNARE-associated domain